MLLTIFEMKILRKQLYTQLPRIFILSASFECRIPLLLETTPMTKSSIGWIVVWKRFASTSHTEIGYNWPLPGRRSAHPCEALPNHGIDPIPYQTKTQSFPHCTYPTRETLLQRPTTVLEERWSKNFIIVKILILPKGIHEMILSHAQRAYPNHSSNDSSQRASKPWMPYAQIRPWLPQV